MHDLQASGVTANSGVLPTIQKSNSWKYIIFGIVNKNTEIGVLNTSLSNDYDEFLKEFPENECRWALYDLMYDSGEGMRNKRIFYHWCVPNRLQVMED